MQRLNLDAENKAPHFIGSWLIEPDSLCEELVKFFEDNKAKQRKGSTGSGVDHEAKQSSDLTIKPIDTNLVTHTAVRRYIDLLFKCYSDYLEMWPFLKENFSRVDIGPFNIQRYLTGEHFRKVHAEREGLQTSHRVFAFMTYLNTVEDGGATEFVHYGLNVKPRCGQTLIWPAEWTHAHCGNIINSGTKYIITGWLHFPPIDLE